MATSQCRFVRQYWRGDSTDHGICERDFSPLAIVELDRVSHARPQRASAYSRKAHAGELAGPTLTRINVADMPNGGALRVQLPRGNEG